jgi:hypothetical protein
LTPAISTTKSERPMPMGARKVSLDFSAASMRIVKMRWAVRNWCEWESAIASWVTTVEVVVANHF